VNLDSTHRFYTFTFQKSIDRDTEITYLDMWAKQSSLRAKLVGRGSPYVWIRALYPNTLRVLIHDIDISTTLEILDDLSRELDLDIPTGFIQKDVEYLSRK